MILKGDCMNKEERKESINFLIGWHCLDPEYVYKLSDDEIENECHKQALIETNNFLEVSGLRFSDDGDLEPDENDWEDIFES